MEYKQFELFISVPSKFFRMKPVHGRTQLALALTPSRKKPHLATQPSAGFGLVLLNAFFQILEFFASKHTGFVQSGQHFFSANEVIL